MVDILTVSDFRLPGGTSHSNAEEVQAQHRMGLSTELVHLNGGMSAFARGLNPRIENLVRQGSATLVPAPETHKATIALLRHPAVIQSAWEQLGPVEVDHVVVVVNAAPTDWLGREHYQPEVAHQLTERAFGTTPLWAPIGPLVREAVAGRVGEEHLRGEDWVNVIDVDHWWVDRQGRDRSGRPVVGRHSRASVQKWPQADERELAYPSDGRWDIRVLGWGADVEMSMGGVPDHWEVHAFGAMAPRDFLAQLDFYVYFHHPDLVEAFGRTILEAIAAGLPAILPPHFEPLFGQAALYCEPEDVAELVESLWADAEAYDAHVALAGALVRHRFGYEAHARRLAELLPRGRLDAGLEPPAPVRTPLPQGLLVVDLGAQDTLVDVVASAGIPTAVLKVGGAPGHPSMPADWVEVIPDAQALSLTEEQWQPVLAARARLLHRSCRPGRVLMTGPRPPSELVLEALGHEVLWWPGAGPRADGGGPNGQPDLPRGVTRVDQPPFGLS